jgi:DNA-binding transcriptional LysR family regulator
MNILNVDLNLLVSFDALVSERHVSRAAARVGITQPAMSNALARLRATFNDPLLVRAGRHLVLTVRAQMLAGPVRQAMHLLQNALQPPRSAAIQSRTFVIGATEYVEHLLLPQLVRWTTTHEPGIRLVFRRLPALFQSPDAELQAGLLDCAIGFFPEAPSLHAGIMSQPLFEDENVCVLRKGHPLVRKRLSLQAYCGLEHATISYQHDVPSILDQLLLAKGLSRKIRLQVPHMATALSIAAQTDLATTMPRRFALRAKHGLSLQSFRVSLDVPALKISVLWHARNDNDSGLSLVRQRLTRIANSIKQRS